MAAAFIFGARQKSRMVRLDQRCFLFLFFSPACFGVGQCDVNGVCTVKVSEPIEKIPPDPPFSPNHFLAN